ncbi:MAG: type II secretion system protein [bacterium]|nr:type II secretion system protein [bacterium]
MKKEKGFTLIEVILVVAIMSIVVTVSLSSWRSFSDATNLGNTAKMIETKIKLAKSYSLSALNDTNYGIRFETDKIILFNAGTSTDIEPYNLTDGVEIYNIGLFGGGVDASCNNGIIDIGEIGVDCGGSCIPCSSLVFNRLTGTSNNGSISTRVKNNISKTKTILINSQGQTGTDTFGVSTTPAIVEDTTNNINARHIHFNLSAWSIQEGPPPTVTDLIFKKSDGTAIVGGDISISSSSFSSSMFNWEGTITVDSVVQKLRIHTLDTSGTTLCIMRDRMQNSKSIKIYFKYSGMEKEVVTYTESTDGSGTVTVTPNYTFVDNPILSQ